MIYFITKVNRSLFNFISIIVHNKWRWLFLNQWFGLHLRWLFSNNFSTCLILVSNIDSIKFLQTEKIGFITRVPDLKINTGCHWFLFFQNNKNDFMLLPWISRPIIRFIFILALSSLSNQHPYHHWFRGAQVFWIFFVEILISELLEKCLRSTPWNGKHSLKE